MTTKVPRRKKSANKKGLAVLWWDEKHYTVEFTPVHPFKSVYYVRVVGADLEVLAEGEWCLRDAVLREGFAQKRGK